jgi:ABC-type hemin transport system substrate-binding protein
MGATKPFPRDAMGVAHKPVDPVDARIVSLVPSITELLFNLNLGDHVVARTQLCVHP